MCLFVNIHYLWSDVGLVQCGRGLMVMMITIMTAAPPHYHITHHTSQSTENVFS